MQDDRDWLVEVFLEAQAKGWCVRPHCTTCGAHDFRTAYLRRAARVAGVKVPPTSRIRAREALSLVSPAERTRIFDALVAAARRLNEGLGHSEATRTLLIDLDPPLMKWGVAACLDELLSGTPAGSEYNAMVAHHAMRLREYAAREAYESPDAVEKRRKEAKRQTADRVRARRIDKEARDSARQSYLEQLASMTDEQRLLELAAEENRFPIDVIPGELVPLSDGTKVLSTDQRQRLIQLIGRRRGNWGELRKSLER